MPQMSPMNWILILCLLMTLILLIFPTLNFSSTQSQFKNKIFKSENKMKW